MVETGRPDPSPELLRLSALSFLRFEISEKYVVLLKHERQPKLKLLPHRWRNFSIRISFLPLYNDRGNYFTKVDRPNPRKSTVGAAQSVRRRVRLNGVENSVKTEDWCLRRLVVCRIGSPLA